jgi:hypothetical protein
MMLRRLDCVCVLVRLFWLPPLCNVTSSAISDSCCCTGRADWAHDHDGGFDGNNPACGNMSMDKTMGERVDENPSQWQHCLAFSFAQSHDTTLECQQATAAQAAGTTGAPARAMPLPP